MQNQPKFLMRRRDVEEWLEGLGISRHTVRRAITKGLLPKVRPFAGNSRAFYRRNDVARIFEIPL